MNSNQLSSAILLFLIPIIIACSSSKEGTALDALHRGEALAKEQKFEQAIVDFT